MKKSLVISEQDSIGALLENDRVVEFFVNRGELLLGDIYTASVENILPGIDAAFVNLGKDKMGFLHANDVPGQGFLKERLVPKQKLLVQITKEPTGHKGPRVSTAISLPGRFLVLVPEERGVSVSRRISEARERARLKSVVNLMKPPGVGLIIRTEAKGQGENELFEDFEQLWDRWQTVVSEGEASIGPSLIYRDQDLLYRVIRDAYSHDINEVIVDSPDGQRRAQEYLQGWAGRQTKVSYHTEAETLLVSKGIDREIEAALSDRAELPSGGHLNIQPTEALTVIDVNSGRFTSSRTQAETVRRTNLEAAQEIARQLRLRNIGGMVIVDFIDMDSRKDQQQVLEVFQRVLEDDRAKPQVGQLSDLGLVELTRRRQGQSLRELFTVRCSHCAGIGVIPTLEIGPADNRRVISFKNREEELVNRNRGAKRPARQGAGILRAASASNGRIVPTITDTHEAHEPHEEFEGVSEDILAQVPDDILQNERNLSNKGFGGTFGDDEESLSESAASVHADEDEEPNFDNSRGKRANFEASNHEDHEGNLHRDLRQNIDDVAQVFHEMENEKGEEHESEDSSETHESQSPPPAFSPFEAEVDPATGIYRLKTRSSDDNSSAESHTEGTEEQSPPWQGEQIQLTFGQHNPRHGEGGTKGDITNES
jgi:Rne/Rng family ribonuclease